MSGILWITSYFVLCGVVLVLSMSLVGVVREISELRRAHITENDSWPLVTVSPGQEWPYTLCRTPDSTYFLYLVGSDLGLAHGYTALSTFCRSSGHALIVAACNETVSLESLVDAHDLGWVSTVAYTRAIESLLVTGNIIVYIRNHRVVDATGRAYTALSLRERFYFAIGKHHDDSLKRERSCQESTVEVS